MRLLWICFSRLCVCIGRISLTLHKFGIVYSMWSLWSCCHTFENVRDRLITQSVIILNFHRLLFKIVISSKVSDCCCKLYFQQTWCWIFTPVIEHVVCKTDKAVGIATSSPSSLAAQIHSSTARLRCGSKQYVDLMPPQRPWRTSAFVVARGDKLAGRCKHPQNQKYMV